jgi:uracil-DNA glycosylase family 4
LTTDDNRAEVRSLAASLRAYLEWHRDAGTEGFPREVARERPQLASSSEPNPKPVETSAESLPAGAARAVMAAPTSSPGLHVRLPQLEAEVASCTRCALSSSRTQTVFARGNSEAALCFVGEAPGAEEDARGLPFVGRAGQLLDRMIVAMGLAPERDVYICNILKCRPPDNRRPEPVETATCIPYLHEQLALVRPRAIVALGNTAVAALLDTNLGITKLRGQWKLYRGQTLVMPTYHPSYLLRPSPQQVEAKRQVWADLQLVMKELGLNPRTTA